MENIILIAQQLSKEGKVPTTALLKARLPKTTSLPMIIQGLKMWKENPHKEINISAASSTITNTDATTCNSFDALIDSRIKQAIAPLVTQIKELKKEIVTLQKQLTMENTN